MLGLIPFSLHHSRIVRPLTCCASICAVHSCRRTSCFIVVMLVVFDCIYFTNSYLSNILQLTPWTNLDCPIYFMVFLGVYYTSLDFGGVGAEGYTITHCQYQKMKFSVSFSDHLTARPKPMRKRPRRSFVFSGVWCLTGLTVSLPAVSLHWYKLHSPVEYCLLSYRRCCLIAIPQASPCN